MTPKAAANEAVRRWGRAAMVQHDRRRKRFEVGVVVFGMMFEVHGTGDTWEAAFKAADEREKRLKNLSASFHEKGGK